MLGYRGLDGEIFRTVLRLDPSPACLDAASARLDIASSTPSGDRVRDLQKAAQVPELTPETAADLAKETELFGVHVTLDIDGDFERLWTLPFSFLTERTASIYGITDVTGPEHRKVALDPADARLRRHSPADPRRS